MDRKITSFLDTDLYTFSVCLAVLENFPRAHIKYEFFDRNSEPFPKGFADTLNEQIRSMTEIKMTSKERQFLEKKCYYFKEWFFDFLMSYRFDPNEVHAWQDEDLRLHVTICGLWYRTIFWEVPLLATISELMHEYRVAEGIEPKYDAEKEYIKSFERGRKLIEGGVKFAEFGTRRRYSKLNHEVTLRALIDANEKYHNEVNGKLLGTSNVYFAMTLEEELGVNIGVSGTMSHQFPCAIAAMYGPVCQEANYFAMDAWTKTYGTDLGIYLYDGLSWDAFEPNFTKAFAKAFDGLRVDSGVNYAMHDKIVAKYKDLGIDPMTKNVVFSNALDVDTAIDINKYCEGKTKCSAGIGGKLTCNVDGVRPLNIVIKAVAVKITEKREWRHVIKISDDLGKHTGDPTTIAQYKALYQK